MNAAHPVREVVGLATDAVSKAADLVRLELRLVRTELTEKLSEWKIGVAQILLAGVFASAALFLVLQAIVVALVEAGMAASLATLIVAGLSLAIAAVCFAAGRARLDTDVVTPDRTLRQLSRDKDLVKEKLT